MLLPVMHVVWLISHKIMCDVLFLPVKMLSGIASYLFGSTMEDALPGDSDDVKLTTFPMENEWLLVDRAGVFGYSFCLYYPQSCMYFLICGRNKWATVVEHSACRHTYSAVVNLVLRNA